MHLLTLFKVVKVTKFDANGKHVCDFLCVNNYNVRYILHVSEVWWIIDSIFAIARGCFCLTQSFWINP